MATRLVSQWEEQRLASGARLLEEYSVRLAIATSALALVAGVFLMSELRTSVQDSWMEMPLVEEVSW
ncbi:MAG: hypothetical protein AAF191_00880 [Verrucomicrobiota bacterium]